MKSKEVKGPAEGGTYMQITHDKKLLIATGRSRKAAQWQNREMLWSEFLEKLARPTWTRTTPTPPLWTIWT